jgi:preprotein translocase subunit SecD
MIKVLSILWLLSTPWIASQMLMAAETRDLKAYVVSGETAITAQDVEDAHLKYDHGAWVVMLRLNASGQNKLQKALAAGLNQKMLLAFGDKMIAAPIGIQESRVSNLFIRSENESAALELLKQFSK